MSFRILSVVALAVLVPSTVLAGKKDKKTEEAPAADAAPAAVPETPADAKSQKFGASLVTSSLRNFRPSDAGGATFQYDEMTFAADNSWTAKGWVEFEDEKMECTESGKWKMDPADSEKVAIVTWTVDKTDCAGRDAGAEVRAEFTIQKDNTITALFR